MFYVVFNFDLRACRETVPANFKIKNRTQSAALCLALDLPDEAPDELLKIDAPRILRRCSFLVCSFNSGESIVLTQYS